MVSPAVTYVGRLRLSEAQAGAILVLVHGLLALSHACFDSLKESPLVVLLVIQRIIEIVVLRVPSS